MSDLTHQFGPITFCIGFLEASLTDVSAYFSTWQRTIFESVKVTEYESPLDKLIPRLEPLTLPPRRSLLVATRSQWTAYFDNSILGTDACGPIGHLSREFGLRGAIVTFAPEIRTGIRGKGTYGSVQFELYGPEADNPLGCIRSVYASDDGGRWEYGATGPVQPFEDVSRYRKRLIRERLTREMLEDYAAALGLHPFDEDFYELQADLVGYFSPQWPPVRECSLREAQIACGF